MLQIGIDPRDETGVMMRRDKVIVINNGKGPIFFDVAGNLANTSVSEVSLRLRGPKDPGFRAPIKFPVSNGVFIGVVQLSSAESRDLSDTDYTYELYSGNNNSHLSDGYIRLQVKAVVSGASPWSMVVIGGVGLIASLLQFFQFFIQRDEAAKPQEVPPSSS
ncbi:MAG: hypothetical protein LC800_10650 [Acidobacteria bacterium]|nr:hypothetical protein [Acidobacteriota bacterium]